MRTIKLPTAAYLDSMLSEDLDCSGGWCIACGSEADGVEPDAERYRCEACGDRAVYGLEELVIRGWIRER